MTWTIAPAGDRLRRDGRDAFLLADTLWAAFTMPTLEEIDDYAQLRRRQGFTGVLISVLSIAHDSAGSPARSPFGIGASGEVDLEVLDPAFFAHAAEVCRRLTGHGLTPVLVLLWNNYVPGSWGARRTPHLVMSEAATRRYVDAVVRAFAPFEPLYLISGDDNFDSDVSIERYSAVAAQVRELAPSALLSWHSGTMVRVPDELAAGPGFDFYGYQSGHDTDWIERARLIPRYYLDRSVRRPILNLEPPYEGHGIDEGRGRHTAREVRRASWLGVLSGAGAGLGYGAHGVWPWYRRGAAFGGEWFSGRPFPAAVALGFEGALHVAFLRELVERHDLYALRPEDALLPAEPSGAVAASTRGGDVLAVFRPHPFAVELTVDRDDAGAYEGVVYDLVRRTAEPATVRRGDEGRLVLDQPEFLADSLTVLTRRADRG